MNRSTRSVPSVFNAMPDPSRTRAVRMATLAARSLALRAARERAPIGEPAYPDGRPPTLYSKGRSCPPTA
ncbi:MAG: hypothetical protein ABW042_05635 [Phenylobacterium sp.]